MPDYTLVFTFLDYQNGTTSRSYTGTFADFTAASAAANAARSAYQAITGAQIIKQQLSEVTEYPGAPPANISVFEQAVMSVELSGGTNDRFAQFIPAAVSAIYSGNNVIITDPLVVDWLAIAGTTGGDGWNVGRGRTIDSVLSGERGFVKSGKTNLPS